MINASAALLDGQWVTPQHNIKGGFVCMIGGGAGGGVTRLPEVLWCVDRCVGLIVVVFRFGFWCLFDMLKPSCITSFIR